jgi:hypothetical protein
VSLAVKPLTALLYCPGRLDAERALQLDALLEFDDVGVLDRADTGLGGGTLDEDDPATGVGGRRGTGGAGGGEGDRRHDGRGQGKADSTHVFLLGELGHPPGGGVITLGPDAVTERVRGEARANSPEASISSGAC